MRLRTVLPLIVAFLGAPAHALTLLTEENPPLNYTEGGRVTGYATEVVAEIGKRARIPIKFQAMPGKEAFELAQVARDACMYSILRIEDREPLFQWVGPIAFDRRGVYAHRDFAGPIKSLDDLKRHRNGAATSDATAGYLKAWGVASLLPVDDDRENVARLFLPGTDANFIDLWVTRLAGARKTAGPRAKDLKLVYTIREVPAWLACSTKVPREIAGKFIGALTSMNKDGAMQKIVTRYEGRFVAQ